MAFHRLSFGFPPIIYQQPLFRSFERYFMGFCLVFQPGMYHWTVYLFFGWYLVGWVVCVTTLLMFGYCHMDIHTLPVYCISSVFIISCCYPMVHASIPAACEDPVDIRVWRSRSSSSSGIYIMDICIKVFFQHERSYTDLTIRLVGFRLCRSCSTC